MFAYQLYLDTKCPMCGGDVRVCRNEENAGAFEALDTTCHRQAAIDERTKQPGFKSEPGQMFYAVPIDDDLIVGSGLTYARFDAEVQDCEPNSGKSGNDTDEAVEPVGSSGN